MKVGFLFNHYLAYQVIHGAPYAFALSEMRPDFAVDMLFTSTASYREARRLAALYPDHRCRLRLLWSAHPLKLISRWRPSCHRGLALAAHAWSLSSYDALAAPEKNFLQLKSLPFFAATRFISLHHGPAGRARLFNKGSLRFDYALVPGQSCCERLAAESPEVGRAMVGYPKFEVLQKQAAGAKASALFDNGRPTVLYAPHFNPQQSSWEPLGRQVLEFFAHNDQYNLVFAPHVRLFEGRPFEDFNDAPNIRVDTGSERSIDMSYTRAADLFLGDVSSQVYEFLHYRRRPCIFLNPRGLDPAQAPFWNLGECIEEAGMLGAALARAPRRFRATYKSRQDAAVDRAFGASEEPPSQRGAAAIARFLAE